MKSIMSFLESLNMEQLLKAEKKIGKWANKFHKDMERKENKTKKAF